MKILYFILIFTLPIYVFARTVESDNFILTDGYGRTTAQLTKSWEGTPALFFYDVKWVPRISIGLYGDGIPGIVLNDEKGLATALLRMVNNQWDPVLVLKENGQDRLIIDKNGTKQWGSHSEYYYLFFWILGGFLGWVMSSYTLAQMNKPVGAGGIIS